MDVVASEAKMKYWGKYISNNTKTKFEIFQNKQ